MRETQSLRNWADILFQEMCRRILTNGEYRTDIETRAKWPDGNDAHTKRVIGVVNEYYLEHEFPLLTIRHVNFHGAMEELLWIWQKKSNAVKDLSTKIWDAWAREDGTIGKAYGYQLGVKHQYAEGEMDQVDRLLYDLKNHPISRRMIVNMYNHQDLHDMALYPCAYSMTFFVSDGKLHGILNQRSQDVIIASGWNVAQYALLIHLLAHVNHLGVGRLVHVIGDAHIYDRHFEVAKEMIESKIVFPAPKIAINPEITNFYDFTPDDIRLIDYHFNKKYKGLEIAE